MVSAPVRRLFLVACLALFMVLGVLRAPQLLAADQPNLILEAGFESPQGYVQAQALYSLRFYQAIDVRDLELHDPVVPLAEVRPIGEDRVGEAVRDGRRYRLTERRYAVFPFASGELAVSGAGVTGRVAARGAASPGEREPVRLDAPTSTLDVLPIPPGADAEAWVPARTLSVTESWIPAPEQARAGEALRRTLRIKAAGLDAAQLPALDFSAPGFAVHPDPPRLENRFEGELNIGVREQSYRVVPLQPGRLEVPTFSLPWWDVVAGRRKEAQLPARTIVAEPAALPLPLPGQPGPAAPPPDEAIAASAPQPDSPVVEDSILGAVLASGGLLVLAGLAWGASRVRARGRRAPLKALREACRRHDAPAARRALLDWAAGRWPERPPRALGDLAERLPEPTVQAAVLQLDRHLYGPVGTSWNGDALQGFSGKVASKRAKSDAAGLPPLYPS